MKVFYFLIITTVFTVPGFGSTLTPRACVDIYSIMCVNHRTSLQDEANKQLASIPSEESADEVPLPKQPRNISVGFGGWSHHETGNKPNLFNQENPTLELDIWLPVTFIGGQPFVGTGRVFKNSRNGATDYFTIANEWKLLSGKYIDLCGGVGVTYAKYRDKMAKPGKRRVAEGEVPLLYGCIDFNQYSLRDYSIRIVPLGSKITYLYLVRHW
jgi:hypothetical protein